MSDHREELSFAFAAEMLKLAVPQACRDGVEANLALLGSHARILEDWLDRQEAVEG